MPVYAKFFAYAAAYVYMAAHLHIVPDFLAPQSDGVKADVIDFTDCQIMLLQCHV